MRPRHLPVALLAVLPACDPDNGLVKFNAEPDAAITSPADGDEVRVGTALALRGAASDANHSSADLTARWFLDDVEVCAGTPAADGTTVCEATVPEADALSVRLEVTDPDGAAGSDSITLAVTPDATPTATIASPTADGVYYSDQLVNLSATVEDAEDAEETLAVRWESSLDGDLGSPSPSSEGLVESFVNLTEGQHALQVFVTDSAGNEGQASVIVDVGPPNSAPSCTITEPADGSAGEVGTPVTFRGTTADADIPEDWLTVTWTSDKDGTLGTSTPASDGSVRFSFAGLSADTHVIAMAVADELGATCTAQVLYTAGAAPTITLEAPTAGEIVAEGAALTFSALVSDGEDAPADLLVAWESSVDGLLYEGPPDSAGVAQFLESALSPGDHALTVTVTDTDGLYTTALGTFTVDGAPTAPGVSIAPASPLTDDDLVVSIDTPAVDPEGASLTYLYAWSVDGVPSGASASATLPASATSRDETWSVSVTATDGLATSAAGTATVTIGNTDPAATVSLTPSAPLRADTLTCAATATDADGDALTYTFAWTVDGASASASSTSGATSTLAGAFVAGDVVTCEVTAGDGTTSATTSASVTIGNAAPTASVTLVPATVYTDDTLTATVTTADADGDTLSTSYTWTVDGVVVASAGSTLSGDNFDRDDVVEVTITVDDGTDVTTASASVTVSNTPPAAPTVTVAPESPLSTEALLCSVATASTDADADGVTYTVAWTVDGVAFGGAGTTTLAGDTVDAADTAEGEVWTCAVTPTDGTDAGLPGTASVTVGDDGGVSILVLSGTDSAGDSHVTDAQLAADFVTASGVAPTLTHDTVAPDTVGGYAGYDVVVISEDVTDSYASVIGSTFDSAAVDAMVAFWEAGGNVYFAREYGTDAVMNELYREITGASGYWSGTTTVANTTTISANTGTLFEGTTRVFLETGGTSSDLGNPTLLAPFVNAFNLPRHSPAVATVVYACEADGSGLLVIDGERGTPWYSAPSAALDPSTGTFGPAVGDVMAGGPTWSRLADCGDSDGDGIKNGVEGFDADTDGDGTLDYLDRR